MPKHLIYLDLRLRPETPRRLTDDADTDPFRQRLKNAVKSLGTQDAGDLEKVTTYLRLPGDRPTLLTPLLDAIFSNTFEGLLFLNICGLEKDLADTFLKTRLPQPTLDKEKLRQELVDDESEVRLRAAVSLAMRSAAAPLALLTAPPETMPHEKRARPPTDIPKRFTILLTAPQHHGYISEDRVNATVVDNINVVSDRVLRCLIKSVLFHDPSNHQQLLDVLWDSSPSAWGEWSLKSVYAKGNRWDALVGVVDDYRLEFSKPEVYEHFEQLIITAFQRATLRTDSPAYFRFSRAFGYVLRVARQLATRLYEGRPLYSTILLPTMKRLKASEDADRPDEAYHWLQCLGYDEPVPFSLSEKAVVDLAELAQSKNLHLWVDPYSCTVQDVIVRKDDEPDRNRCYSFRKLAQEIGGFVIHTRAQGGVEVYSADDDLQLWYTGFDWQARPYTRTRQRLEKFFSHEKRKQLALRIIGAIVELIDRQAGSILGFVTSPEFASLEEHRIIEPMRRNVKLHNTDGRWKRLSGNEFTDIKSLPLDALVGLLQVDGAHLITQEGMLLRIAQDVSRAAHDRADGESRQAGSGRQAAQRLSKYLTQGFAIKISAARRVYVFQQNADITDEPLTEAADDA